MSRSGRNPITVPAGVDVTIGEANLITVKGPLGTLEYKFSPILTFERDGDVITVKRPDDEKESRAIHGTSRTVLNNMIVGVKEGYKKTLQIVGVGYKAVKSGNVLQLYLGQSLVDGKPQAKYCMTEGDGITFEVPNDNTIIVKGYDKQKVGYIAAQIREQRPPEPYHGKGVKYDYEHIRRKAGKTGK